MGYEPLYDALQYGKRTSDFLGRFYFYFILFYFILFQSSLFLERFIKTFIQLPLVGCEITITNSALRALLAICHLISNVCSWKFYINVTACNVAAGIKIPNVFQSFLLEEKPYLR